MISVRLENFRSLKDTGFIDIKPLTILVGENSSGKSSFLRFFPLMKQSFQRKIKGPILWAGEDDYVDFGGFCETLSKNSSNESIVISFKTKLERITSLFRIRPTYMQLLQNTKPIDVEIKVSIKSNEYDFIDTLSIKILDSTIYILLDDKGKIKDITINGINLNKKVSYELFNFSQSIVPVLHIVNEKRNTLFEDDYDKLPVKDWFKKYCYDGRVTDNSYTEIAAEAIGIILSGNSNLKEELVSSNISITIINKLKTLNNENFIELKSLILLSVLDKITEALYYKIKDEFINSFYIAPIRAEANRYYRIQNIAVEEIDHQGKNIAMLLNCLSYDKINELQEWMKLNVGFYPEITKSGEGHLSVKISDDNFHDFNLADTGFGYSQILPILVQLWLLLSGNIKTSLAYMPYNNKQNTNNNSLYLLIEQPELHLHPAMQAKFIDVIIKAIHQLKNYNENTSLYVILETHSETIINRIGKHIYYNKLNNDDINVVLFSKEHSEETSIVTNASYDNEGYLVNWPLGFLQPDEL